MAAVQGVTIKERPPLPYLLSRQAQGLQQGRPRLQLPLHAQREQLRAPRDHGGPAVGRPDPQPVLHPLGHRPQVALHAQCQHLRAAGQYGGGEVAVREAQLPREVEDDNAGIVERAAREDGGVGGEQLEEDVRADSIARQKGQPPCSQCSDERTLAWVTA